jgi:hypothetical protein
VRRSIAALLGLSLWLAAALSPAMASAAPPPSYVVTFDCSDGQTYDINFGAPPNAGSVGFVMGTTNVFVGKSFTGYFEGEVAFSWVRGVGGFDPGSLIVCTGALDPMSYELTGWVAPRG